MKRKRRRRKERSEQESWGASGSPAWGPSLYRKRGSLPLYFETKVHRKHKWYWDKKKKKIEEIEQKLPVAVPVHCYEAKHTWCFRACDWPFPWTRMLRSSEAGSQAGETGSESGNKGGEGCLQTRLLNWLGWGPFHSSLHKMVVYFRWITTNSQIEPLSAVYTVC